MNLNVSSVNAFLLLPDELVLLITFDLCVHDIISLCSVSWIMAVEKLDNSM
jgi:hypothetical protein